MSSRFTFLVVLAILALGGAYWELGRKAPAPEAGTASDAPPSTEQSPPPRDQPGETQQALAPAPEQSPSPAATTAASKDANYTKDPKVRLDIAMLLLKSAAFREANPGLTIEKFASGAVPLSAIHLPDGLKLNYQYDPSCQQHADPGEEANGGGAPFFRDQTLATAQTAQDLSDTAAHDPCIAGMSVESAALGGGARSPGSTAQGSGQAQSGEDPAQKAAMDSAVQSAAANGATPLVAVIGTHTDLSQADPNLMTHVPGTHGLAPAPADYPVGGGSASSDTSAGLEGSSASSVAVNIKAVPVRSPDGTVSDAAASNAIARAVASGAQAVDLNVPNAELSNLQPAINNAIQHGVTVVTGVPLPQTHSAASAATTTTPGGPAPASAQ